MNGGFRADALYVRESADDKTSSPQIQPIRFLMPESTRRCENRKGKFATQSYACGNWLSRFRTEMHGLSLPPALADLRFAFAGNRFDI